MPALARTLQCSLLAAGTNTSDLQPVLYRTGEDFPTILVVTGYTYLLVLLSCVTKSQ